MNDPNWEYYKIDTNDIWEYEKSLFFHDKSSEEHILYLIGKYEQIILYTYKWQKKSGLTVTVEPFTDIKKFDSGEDKIYFEKTLRAFVHAKSLKDKIALQYFMVKDDFFSYNQTIFINPTHPDFDFWFSLKLRQYNNKVIFLTLFYEDYLLNVFQSCK